MGNLKTAQAERMLNAEMDVQSLGVVCREDSNLRPTLYESNKLIVSY